MGDLGYKFALCARKTQASWDLRFRARAFLLVEAGGSSCQASVSYIYLGVCITSQKL